MSETKDTGVKKPAGWMIFLGILVILSGILAIGAPLVAGISVTIFVGAMIIVAGISQLVHAFSLKIKQGLIVKIILSILAVIAGLFLLINPLQGLLGLTIIIGIYFIADGIGWITMAFSHKPEKGWGWHLFSGIISVLLGIMILKQWPLSGVWAIGVLFGIRMLNAGFGMAFFGSAIRSRAK
ncbi:MAG: HdeD family acid-resistance protein [Spirochaetes bacterium]|nr:MAG: HdeD family acid-resistance protein [Spirochaetota bacterium]